MTIPSLRLIRHARTVLSSYTTLIQPLPFNRLTSRELCASNDKNDERSGNDETLKNGSTGIRKKLIFNRNINFLKNGPQLSALPLHDDCKKVMDSNRLFLFSHFQKEAIEAIMNGENLVIRNEPGSGKTMCYLISIVNMTIGRKIPMIPGVPWKPFAVILTANRENGIRIFDRFIPLLDSEIQIKHEFGTGKPHVSGEPNPFFQNQRCDIFISSPMRLTELVNDGLVSLSGLEILVVDDYGLIPAHIIRSLKTIEIKHPYQMIVTGVVFSLNEDSLKKMLPSSPSVVMYNLAFKIPPLINQQFLLTSDPPLSNSRLEALLKELDKRKDSRGVIFCNTIEMVRCLESELYHRGYNTTPYHSQQKRETRALSIESFMRRKSQILVATPMASCIDLTRVDYVINYEMPMSIINYLQQVGRCGRLRKRGEVVTFVTREEVKMYDYLLPLLNANKMKETKELLFPDASDDEGEEEKGNEEVNSNVDDEELNSAEIDKTPLV